MKATLIISRFANPKGPFTPAILTEVTREMVEVRETPKRLYAAGMVFDKEGNQIQSCHERIASRFQKRLELENGLNSDGASS